MALIVGIVFVALSVFGLDAPSYAGHLVVSAKQEFAAYRVTPPALEDTGVRIKMKGSPASIRIAPR